MAVYFARGDLSKMYVDAACFDNNVTVSTPSVKFRYIMRTVSPIQSDPNKCLVDLQNIYLQFILSAFYQNCRILGCHLFQCARLTDAQILDTAYHFTRINMPSHMCLIFVSEDESVLRKIKTHFPQVSIQLSALAPDLCKDKKPSSLTFQPYTLPKTLVDWSSVDFPGFESHLLTCTEHGRGIMTLKRPKEEASKSHIVRALHVLAKYMRDGNMKEYMKIARSHAFGTRTHPIVFHFHPAFYDVERMRMAPSEVLIRSVFQMSAKDYFVLQFGQVAGDLNDFHLKQLFTTQRLFTEFWKFSKSPLMKHEPLGFSDSRPIWVHYATLSALQESLQELDARWKSDWKGCFENTHQETSGTFARGIYLKYGIVSNSFLLGPEPCLTPASKDRIRKVFEEQIARLKTVCEIFLSTSHAANMSTLTEQVIEQNLGELRVESSIDYRYHIYVTSSYPRDTSHVVYFGKWEDKPATFWCDKRSACYHVLHVSDIPLWYEMIAAILFTHSYISYDAPFYQTPLGKTLQKGCDLTEDAIRKFFVTVGEEEARSCIYHLIGVDIKTLDRKQRHEYALEALLTEVGLGHFVRLDDSIKSNYDVTDMRRIFQGKSKHVQRQTKDKWVHREMASMKQVKIYDLLEQLARDCGRPVSDMTSFFGYMYDKKCHEDKHLLFAYMIAKTWKNQHHMDFEDNTSIVFDDISCSYPSSIQRDLRKRIERKIREWHEEIYTPQFPMSSERIGETEKSLWGHLMSYIEFLPSAIWL